METGLEMLKNAKALGANDVSPECLRNRGKRLIKQIHNLINKIWEQEEISTAWRTSILCLVF